MADDVATNASNLFEHYQRLATEYRACVIRCEQALDQLRTCGREFRDAVHAVGGQMPVDTVSDSQVDQLLGQLSQRELEIFVLIGHWQTTSQIAAHCNLSLSTVETYRERLKAKLSLASGHELTRRAVQWASHVDGNAQAVTVVDSGIDCTTYSALSNQQTLNSSRRGLPPKKTKATAQGSQSPS